MSQKNKGIILIITSAFFFALMNMMVRLAGDLPSIEKSFFRNFVAVFFALIALKKSHTPVHIPKGQLKNLLMRSICGTLGILCNYYAIDHLMLADASILNKLSPFFAILFSSPLYQETSSYNKDYIHLQQIILFCLLLHKEDALKLASHQWHLQSR